MYICHRLKQVKYEFFLFFVDEKTSGALDTQMKLRIIGLKLKKFKAQLSIPK